MISPTTRVKGYHIANPAISTHGKAPAQIRHRIRHQIQMLGGPSCTTAAPVIKRINARGKPEFVLRTDTTQTIYGKPFSISDCLLCGEGEKACIKLY
jgi:hypothetical protein